MIFMLQWFYDVCSREISQKCEDVLNLLSETYNCQVKDFSFKYSTLKNLFTHPPPAPKLLFQG